MTQGSEASEGSADPEQRLRQAIEARQGGRRAGTRSETGAFSFLARVPRRAAEDVALSAACRDARSVVATRPSIGAALDYAYGTRFRTFDTRITPNQIPYEIEAFLELLAALRPRTILEIGTSLGGTLFLVATVATDDALLISLDLPESGPWRSYPRRRRKLYRAFARRGQRIEVLRANSHDVATLELVRTALAGRRLDLLFIDGDHAFDGVKQDYETFGPLVREGGLIAFHDIVPGSPSSSAGCRPSGRK